MIELDVLYGQSQEAAAVVSTTYTRELHQLIDWKHRLIAIRGPRGVGKTTLLLQHLKLNYGSSPEALYVTLDDFFFTENRLVNVAKEFYAKGGKVVYLDEVHKYPQINWAQEIKNIYDLLPGLKVVFTGSSILKILNEQADLSRRALIYNLQGLSLREYIDLAENKKLPVFSFEEIINRHHELANQIVHDYGLHPLQFFKTYLREGYFPFFLENRNIYLNRVREVLKLIIEVDLNYLPEYTITDHVKINRLLYAIATSAPFKPNISKLSERIGLNRNRLTEYIYLLERARLLNLMHSRHRGVSSLQKPEKIYLENTNLTYALAPNQVNHGSLRETFFLNQLSAPQLDRPFPLVITYPEKGDFLVDNFENSYLFEVGGKNKDLRQVRSEENAFIAADDIEVSFDRRIPLWLFGFLY